MLVLLAALLMIYALFLPVTIQADIYHHGTTQTRITAHFTCFTKGWHIRRLYGTAAQLRQRRSRMLLALLRRADRPRRFLLRHIHLNRLDVLVLLRTDDAARSALLSGALQGALACIPAILRRNARIRVLPEFFRARSTVSARCIIRLRVGTIILTAMMLLAAYLHGQRLTESEAV